MKCEECNVKDAEFSVWIHRNITLSSFFCSIRCCKKYAKYRGWKYSKGKLTKWNYEINLDTPKPKEDALAVDSVQKEKKE